MRLEDLVSIDRRRRRIALRPIVWVGLAVFGLMLGAALWWGVSQIVRGLGPAPLPTTVPPESDIGAAAPVSPTPAPELYPVTWTVRLGRDEAGRNIGIVDDPAVHAAVRQGFLDAREWAFESESPHNLADATRYFAPLPDTDDPIFQPDPGWWFGLEPALERLAWEAEQGVLVRNVAGGEWDVTVERFSTNGRRAVVRGRSTGQCRLEVVDTRSGERVQDVEIGCWTFVAGMLYDTADGRWKVVALRQFSPTRGGETG